MQALNDQMHETTIGRRYLVVAFMRPIPNSRPELVYLRPELVLCLIKKCYQHSHAIPEQITNFQPQRTFIAVKQPTRTYKQFQKMNIYRRL